MTQCFECGTHMVSKCPSCEAVSAREALDEALDEARAEGRRAGIEEAISTIQRATTFELADIDLLTQILQELLEDK